MKLKGIRENNTIIVEKFLEILRYCHYNSQNFWKKLWKNYRKSMKKS